MFDKSAPLERLRIMKDPGVDGCLSFVTWNCLSLLCKRERETLRARVDVPTGRVGTDTQGLGGDSLLQSGGQQGFASLRGQGRESVET